MDISRLSYRIIEQAPGLEGIYAAAELPGRICYGSTDKIAPGSAEEFVNRLMRSNHGAPLEHASVYLILPEDYIDAYEVIFRENPYSRVTYNCADDCLYVSTNLRVLFENEMLDLLKFVAEPVPGYHKRRITVEFNANIGVTREFNRHRTHSINEESTQYCNYSKDKFGSEISVIENAKFYGKEDELEEKSRVSMMQWAKRILNNDDFFIDYFTDIDYWCIANAACEWAYMNLIINCGWKQQDARDVLPLDTRSKLIHTAFIDDWIRFFNLRAIGTTGAPHPQAKELAEPLMREFISRGLIKEDERGNIYY